MGSIQTITSPTLSLLSEQTIKSPNKPHKLKTLDIGLDGSTISTNSFGDILQLSSFHPLHGVVVACPFAQFDGNRFYDSDYVRTYRKKLLDYVHSGERGFGIHLEGTISDLDFDISANNITITYSLGRLHVTTTISVCGSRGVIQSTVLKSTATKTIQVGYKLALNISVNRASYGQLTEGGPIPIPPPRNEFQLFDGSRAWAVINPNLDAMVQGSLFFDGLPVLLEPLKVEDVSLHLPVRAAFRGTVQILPGTTHTLTSTYRLQPGTKFAELLSSLTNVGLSPAERWAVKNENMNLIVKGNLSYILGNCTIPVSKSATCLITDHVALPLGWNRDNYWQIRYLLDIHQNMNQLTNESTAQK